MDFFEAVNNRYSYRRKFDTVAPSLEDLKKIVQAGQDAPSGKNAQTTGFLIIKDPEIVSLIQTMPGGNPAMKTALAYIAAHISSDPEKIYEGHDFEIEDCASP
jgi:nitroreductase